MAINIPGPGIFIPVVGAVGGGGVLLLAAFLMVGYYSASRSGAGESGRINYAISDCECYTGAVSPIFLKKGEKVRVVKNFGNGSTLVVPFERTTLACTILTHKIRMGKIEWIAWTWKKKNEKQSVKARIQKRISETPTTTVGRWKSSTVMVTYSGTEIENAIPFSISNCWRESGKLVLDTPEGWIVYFQNGDIKDARYFGSVARNFHHRDVLLFAGPVGSLGKVGCD